MLLYTLLYVLVCCIFLWIIMSGDCRHFTHMLQLNSYYNSRYMNYLGKNKKSLIEYKAIIALAAGLFLFVGVIPAVAGYALLYLVIDMIFPKKAEKKPLAVTDRVKRLFVTETIITAAILAVGLFIPGRFAILMLFIAAFITPLTVLLANCINMPIEEYIKKSFYNKAKKKLEAMPRLQIIGITGSYGKTSVKNYLTALLSEKYNTLMTPHSYNTTMGVVRTVNEMLTPLHEIFVVEMGARNKGDIKEICDLVNPKMGIITSVGPQHLETFKSVETVLETKFELCDAVGSGKKFLNYDNEYVRNAKTDGEVITYGTTSDCDYYAEDIKSTPEGSEFTLSARGEKKRLQTRLLGRHNVVNLVGSAAVAIECGVSIDDIATAMKRIESVEHRLQIKKGQGCTIIDDAYNSNPTGAASALETLKEFDGCRIVITPGMVELGDVEQEENEKLGALAAECADYAIFVGEKQYPILKAGAQKVTDDENKMICAKDIYQAFDIMRNIQAENKIVLLENDLPDNYL